MQEQLSKCQMGAYYNHNYCDRKARIVKMTGEIGAIGKRPDRLNHVGAPSTGANWRKRCFPLPE